VTLGFSDFIRKVISETEPCSQNTGESDLGFGWLYYGFVRNLKPEFVVAIGSRRGFMPFCVARALQDNGHGRLLFVDPSYSGDGPPGWSGRGYWSDPRAVEEWIRRFDLEGWVIHLRMTSDEALPEIRRSLSGRDLGMVVIDGAHDYETSLRDFESYSSLISTGVVFFHDATNPLCSVARTLDTLRERGYPVLTIERDVGLAMVEVRAAPAVREKWNYLRLPSNRAKLIEEHARTILRPDDRVMDAYCGFSPLGLVLTGVSLFGWDSDPRSIEELRNSLPTHRWERIEERDLPFSAVLPEVVDVLLGLGVSLGYAEWDPKYVRQNMAYLIGRYHPRAVLLETAADYHEAEILLHLEGILRQHGYHCRSEIIQTDLASFSRRKLLLADISPTENSSRSLSQRKFCSGPTG